MTTLLPSTPSMMLPPPPLLQALQVRFQNDPHHNRHHPDTNDLPSLHHHHHNHSTTSSSSSISLTLQQCLHQYHTTTTKFPSIVREALSSNHSSMSTTIHHNPNHSSTNTSTNTNTSNSNTNNVLIEIEPSYQYITTIQIPQLWKQLHMTTTTTVGGSSNSSIVHTLESMATMGRFMDYLLLFLQSEHSHDTPTTTTTTHYQHHPNSSHMILHILTTLTEQIIAAWSTISTSVSIGGVSNMPTNTINEYDMTWNLYSPSPPPPNNDDEYSIKSHPIIVMTIFVFGILLRYNDDCRQGHPYLLSTLYKSLCQLVISSRTSTTTTSTPTTPTFTSIIPWTLRQQAIIFLLDHIRDGMETIRPSLLLTTMKKKVDHVTGGVTPTTSAAAAAAAAAVSPPVSPLVLKIITFLVARLQTFLMTLRLLQPTNDDDDETSTTRHNSTTTASPNHHPTIQQHTIKQKQEEEETIRKVLQTLVQLWGIITVSLSQIAYPNTVTTTTATSLQPQPQLQRQHGTLLNKIDACFVTCMPTHHNHRTDTTVTHNMSTVVRYRMVQRILLDMGRRSLVVPSMEDCTNSISNGNTNDVDGMTSSIGTMHVILKYFTTMPERQAQPQPSIATTLQSCHNDRDRVVDDIFQLLEEFMWHVLPSTFVRIQRYQNDQLYPHSDRATIVNLCQMLLPIHTILPTIVSTLCWIEQYIMDTTDTLGKSTIAERDVNHVTTTFRWTIPRFYQRLIHWLSYAQQCGGIGKSDDGDHTILLSCPRQSDWMIHVLVQYLDVTNTTNHDEHGHHLWLTFMIQLLFDDRTDTTLRRNLSSVLIRSMSIPTTVPLPNTSTAESNDNTNTRCDATKLVSSFVVGCAILSRVPAFLEVPTPTKKRKNYWDDDSEDDDNEGSDKAASKRVNSTPSHPSPTKMKIPDLCIILSVLENVPMKCADAFHELVPAYEQSFENSLPHTNTLHTTIDDYDVHVLSILTSLMHLYQSPNLLYEQLVSEAYKLSLTIQEIEPPSKSNERTIEYSRMWITAVLHHLRCSILPVTKKKVDNTNRIIDIDLTCKLLHSVLRGTDTKLAMDTSQSYIALLIEAIQVLGGIGTILDEQLLMKYSLDKQQQILQILVDCFSFVLSSPHWTIRWQAISSLVQFASTIPPKYKCILPKCVPLSMQKALQCRLQNKIYLDDTNMNENDIQLLQQQLVDKFLYKWMERQHQFQSSHSSTKRIVEEVHDVERHDVNDPCNGTARSNTFIVPVGSFCMTMPTQEGRSAMVIFPPNALDDICTMIQQQQDDDEEDGNEDMVGTVQWMEEHTIQRLHHEAVLSFDTRSTKTIQNV